MTREEAANYIAQTNKLKDILDHLTYTDELSRKHDLNCRHVPGEGVYFNFMYEAGDVFVEDRIRDILLHLTAKYENQLSHVLPVSL